MKYKKAIISAVYGMVDPEEGLIISQEKWQLDLKELSKEAPKWYNRVFARAISLWPTATCPVINAAIKAELKKRGSIKSLETIKFTTNKGEYIYINNGKVIPIVGIADYFHSMLILK